MSASSTEMPFQQDRVAVSSLESGLVMCALVIMAAGWLGIWGPEGVPTPNVVGGEGGMPNIAPRYKSSSMPGAAGDEGWNLGAWVIWVLLGLYHQGRRTW